MLLLLRRWILPLSAGALAGWLAVRLRPAAETRDARGGPVPGAIQTGVPIQEPAAEAPRKALAAAGKAGAMADRELGVAEDFLQRVAAAGEAELPALYKEMRKLPHSIASMLMETALWRRWVELDPAKGMAWIQKYERDLAGRLFSVWLRQDQSAALSWLAAHPGKGGQDGWESFGMNASPEEMRRLTETLMADAKALPGFSMRLTLMTLAQTDPAEARRLFEGVAADHPERLTMLTQFAEGLSDTDPAAAVAWVRGLSSVEGEAEAAVLATILHRAGAKEPALVRTLAEQCDLPADKMMVVRGGIAAGLSREGPAALREFLQTLPRGSIDREKSLEVHRMPAGNWSVAEMEKLGEEMMRTGMGLTDQVWDWTGRDPMQDLSALAALPGDSSSRGTLMHSLVQAVWESGAIPAGVETVQKWPENIRGQAAQNFLGVAAMTGDAAAVQRWLPLIPPDQAAGTISMLMARGDAEELAAAKGLLDRLPAEARAASFKKVGAQWAQTDPGAVAAWAAALPEADQPAALQGLTESLALTDDVAASEWVNALPPGAARDGAAGALVDCLTVIDPPAALEWALSIGDAERRRRGVEYLTKTWLASEGPAAVEALRAAAFQEEDRALVDKAIEAAQRQWKEGK